MSISAGTYTIGTGGDYSNLYAFFADITNLTNDIKGTIISDITETQTINPTIQLNGNTLIITSSKPTLGKLNTGWKVNRNFSGNMLMFQFSATGTGGTCKISGFELKALSATGNGYDIYFYEANNTQKYYCHDIIFNGDSQGSVPIGSNFTTTNGSLNIWNCISYKTGYGFYLPCDGTVYIENCVSAYSTAGNGYDFVNKPVIVKNCVGISNFNLDFNRTAGATGYNNASSDNSADGTWNTKAANVNAITASNEFIDPVNGDYTIKNGASIKFAGTMQSISENAAGICGCTRKPYLISKGAFEAAKTFCNKFDFSCGMGTMSKGAINHPAPWVSDTTNNFLNTGDVVFLGDSITYGAGSWSNLTGVVNARNRGITGDQTNDILARYAEVYRCIPSKVFLMIGINDISAGVATADIINRIYSITDGIHTNSPTTIIYLQSILPATNASWVTGINTVNAAIATGGGAHNYTYIELHSKFVDTDNYIKDDLTSDGIHLNDLGYTNWVWYIRNYL